MRPYPRTETGLGVPDFRTDSIAETGNQTTRATGARQSPARNDFIAKQFYFNDIHYRCACRLPSCLFAANFAQKSVPKIGKICTILGAVCNLNVLNTLSKSAGSFGTFSTKSPLSILTTPHSTQWRSSKIVSWLLKGKHAT